MERKACSQLNARTKIFVNKDEHKFSCAHMTIFADKSKERLHGHNFHVGVVIDLESADPLHMLDFARVKTVLSQICAELREHLLIARDSPCLRIVRRDASEIEMILCGKRYVLPADEVIELPMDNVVVENLAAYLWHRVRDALRDDLARSGARELEVTVTEGPGQGASFTSSLTTEFATNRGVSDVD